MVAITIFVVNSIGDTPAFDKPKLVEQGQAGFILADEHGNGNTVAGLLAEIQRVRHQSAAQPLFMVPVIHIVTNFDDFIQGLSIRSVWRN